MIEYYRSRIADLEGKNRNLRTLEGQLNSVVSSLKASKSSLENASTGNNNAFSEDGVGCDGNNLKNCADKVQNIISNITGSIIPDINKQISQNNSGIADYNYYIRKEQEKQKGAEG